jgi:hypothetical protein
VKVEMRICRLDLPASASRTFMCKIAVFFKDSFLALLPGSLGFTTNMGGTAAGISGTPIELKHRFGVPSFKVYRISAILLLSKLVMVTSRLSG